VQCAQDKLQAHEDRYRVRLRHARAEIERLGLVFEASQDGLSSNDKWTETEHYQELDAVVCSLEQECDEGSQALHRQLRKVEMQLLNEETVMLEQIRSKLTESPEGLDHWFVQADPSSNEELSRSGFPSNQEAVLFQVESTVASERQELEAEKQRRVTERAAKQRQELDRLRLLEAAQAQDASTADAQMEDVRFESPKSTDPVVEITHWREMALREHAESQQMRKAASEAKSALQGERDAKEEAERIKLELESDLGKQVEARDEELKKLREQNAATNGETQAVVHRMVGMAKELNTAKEDHDRQEQEKKAMEISHREQIQKLQMRMQTMRDANDTAQEEAASVLDDTQNELENAERRITELAQELQAEANTASERLSNSAVAEAMEEAEHTLSSINLKHEFELNLLRRERDELADLWDTHDCSAIKRLQQQERPHTTDWISNDSQPPTSRGNDGRYKPALPPLVGLEEGMRQSLEVEMQENAEDALVAAQVGLGEIFNTIQGRLIAKPQEFVGHDIPLVRDAAIAQLTSRPNTARSVVSPRTVGAWRALLNDTPPASKFKLLTKSAFLKLVVEMHAERVTQPAAENFSEPMFVADFFKQRYGLQGLADSYLMSFLCTLVQFDVDESVSAKDGLRYYLVALKHTVSTAMENQKCIVLPYANHISASRPATAAAKPVTVPKSVAAPIIITAKKTPSPPPTPPPPTAAELEQEILEEKYRNAPEPQQVEFTTSPIGAGTSGVGGAE